MDLGEATAYIFEGIEIKPKEIVPEQDARVTEAIFISLFDVSNYNNNNTPFQPKNKLFFMKKIKLLITGSRKWKNYDYIENVINSIKPDLIIHGNCEGADKLADEVANVFFYSKKIFQADWSIGKKAGPLRNQKMIDENPTICIAFHEDPNLGTGTKDCVMRCLKNGIPVRLFLSQNEIISKYKVGLNDENKLTLEPF